MEETLSENGTQPGVGIGTWVALAIIAGFLALGISAFQGTLTPYVSFDEARREVGTVQVAGALVQGTDSYDEVAGELHFTLTEEGVDDKIDVVYAGLKPANFNDAISVVAIGRWNGSVVEAEKLLVKCPSKYQGEEVKEYGDSEVG